MQSHSPLATFHGRCGWVAAVPNQYQVSFGGFSQKNYSTAQELLPITPSCMPIVTGTPLQ